MGIGKEKAEAAENHSDAIMILTAAPVWRQQEPNSALCVSCEADMDMMYMMHVTHVWLRRDKQ